MIATKGYIDYDLTDVSHKELRALNFFWLGFIMYTSADLLFKALPYYIVLNKIQLVGLFLIAGASISLIQLKLENTYLKIFYFLYCGWLFVTIARGIRFDREFLFNAFFNTWFGIMPYFAPILLLFPKNLFYLKKLSKVIAILGIVFIVYCIMFREELRDPGDNVTGQLLSEFFSKTLSVPCGFLLITYVYQPKARKALAFAVVMLTILLALIRGRRALLFMNLSYLIIFYIIYLYVNKVKFSILVLSLFLIGLLSLAGLKLYHENKRGAFNLITDRITEDTRTPVEKCFYDDMKTKDWIIGKGMMGTYYCPGVDDTSSETVYTDYRSMIETDYLNIILKGGIISLGLLLLITIPAVVKGLFYSKNILSKAAALWILLWLIDLYPATVTTFTLNHLLVWISVGICYSKTIRNMEETAIQEIFSSSR